LLAESVGASLTDSFDKTRHPVLTLDRTHSLPECRSGDESNRNWGAQTQRSLHHFSIGDDHIPKELSRAYGIVKKAAAEVNLADERLALVARVIHSAG
jgi:hypothetical protein